MSKMNALSIEQQEAAYEEYVEFLNQKLRKEGAEELRKEILRAIEEKARVYAGSNSVDLGLVLASDIVKRATI